MKFSIIIPAHNEDQYITGCFESIDRASKPYPDDVEVIVVLNRCTDTTEDIARNRGAKIVREDRKNIAKIRNAGARQATGDILVTIDADSAMSDNMLVKIDTALSSGKCIGGGVPILPSRFSAGIHTTLIFLNTMLRLMGISGGLYWCYRKDFEAVNGFNEMLIMGEDLEFAARLKQYGQKRRLRFIKLPKVHITTSMRKGDEFGDWFFLKELMPQVKYIIRRMKGKHDEYHYRVANRFFYDQRNKEKK